MIRDASLERTPYGSLLDSPAFGAVRDRGTTRRPTSPRQGSGRRVSSRLSVTRAVSAEGQPRLIARRRAVQGSEANALTTLAPRERFFQFIRQRFPRSCRPTLTPGYSVFPVERRIHAGDVATHPERARGPGSLPRG